MNGPLRGHVNALKAFATVAAVSASGALSPGPLSASAVAAGVSLGVLGGLTVATGHMLFELPYFLLLLRWRRLIERNLRRLTRPMGLAVSAFMVFFSSLLLRDAVGYLHGQAPEVLSGHSIGVVEALWAGLVFTGLNPYFLLWWLTVGQPILALAGDADRARLAFVYVGHVWMDYAWLALLAVGGGAAGLMGPSAYGALLVLVAVMLLFFAVRVAKDSLRIGASTA